MKKIIIVLMLLFSKYAPAQNIQYQKFNGFLILEFRSAETHSPFKCYFLCGQYILNRKNLTDSIPFKMENDYALAVKEHLVKMGDSSATNLRIGGNYILDNDSNYLKYVFHQETFSFQAKSKQIYTKENQRNVYWIVFPIKGEVWDCKNITISESDKRVDKILIHHQPNYVRCNCSKYIPNNHVMCPKSKMVFSPLSKKWQKKLGLVKENISAIELLIEL